MNIIQFYLIMGIFPIYLLNTVEKKERYKQLIFPLLQDFYNKLLSQAFYKSYTDKLLSSLDRDLSLFISEYESVLTPREHKFLNNLDKLTKQIKRFVRSQNANSFPAIFLNLTDIELILFIENLRKVQSIDTSIYLLEDPLYRAFCSILLNYISLDTLMDVVDCKKKED